MLDTLDRLSIRKISLRLGSEKYKLLLINRNLKENIQSTLEEFKNEMNDVYVYNKLYEETRLGKKCDLSLITYYLVKNLLVIPKGRLEIIKRALINKICLEKRAALYFPFHHQEFIFNDIDEILGKESRQLLFQ